MPAHISRGVARGPAARLLSEMAPIFDIEDDGVISCLDLRVAEIEQCATVDGSDKLFLEQIDVGEDGPP